MIIRPELEKVIAILLGEDSDERFDLQTPGQHTKEWVKLKLGSEKNNRKYLKIFQGGHRVVYTFTLSYEPANSDYLFVALPHNKRRFVKALGSEPVSSLFDKAREHTFTNISRKLGFSLEHENTRYQKR